MRNRLQFSLIRIESDILDSFIAFLRITNKTKQLWDFQHIFNYNYSQVFQNNKKKGYEIMSSLIESIRYKSKLKATYNKIKYRMRDYQGQSLMPWDDNLEAYKAFQKSLSALEDQMASFIFLKLFFIKYMERDTLQILGYSLLKI